MKYRENWQYATNKEVIFIHEVVSPYDWELEVETNEHFNLWKKEMRDSNG